MSDDSDSAPVLWEQRGGLVILRLNRPDAMNAMTLEIKNALNEFVPRFFADPECRCLMITGTGRAFCAGGDVRNMKGEQVPAEVRARLTISHNGWARDILQGEKPVVMAVNGPAVGAGFGLAMLGDIVLASKSAMFMAGFSSIGAAADMGLAATLPLAVGSLRAKEILFTPKKVKADEAERIGIANQVYDDASFEAEAIAFAQNLAEGPTVGIGLTKALMAAGTGLDMTSLLKMESLAQVLAFASEDRAEGAAAFAEKRSPKFRGR
ncbi:enoyl-CoA hydratase/isomerase family protein [Oceanicola sp. 502str15]|uniref:enoyl-CoA hydratase/isomerase family protein n=1 Tax=Oceanicola sp. 502str15 TaxID=2696061 RepID=UPI00209509F4|nr:enoyl-CoA hydratase-related protein [Oceanicola sp. 502str15]MCO6385323.1 enoyl-CoA hydratase/isomerase family protein [Oceanicola sp. 502str15]